MTQQEQPTIPLLTTSLTQSGLPAPSPTFLTPILTTSSPTQRLPPLSSLLATARLRLLSSDFSHANILHASTPTFPPSLSSPTQPTFTLPFTIPVQILDIIDVSSSKWEQISTLESERKGETTKGRSVIRVLPPTQADDSTQAIQNVNAGQDSMAARKEGLLKVLLQDMKGNRVYGFEMRRVEKLGYPPFMSIGCKVMLKKGCKVARGMVLLEPSCVVVLGGKIEALDKAWRGGREARLREMVEKEPER